MSIMVPRECDEIIEGWYDLRGVTGLWELLCKLDLSLNRDSRLERGDLTGLRSVFLREGPSGSFGSKVTKASLSEAALGDLSLGDLFIDLLGDFHRNLKLLVTSSSSSLRDARCSAVETG